MILFRFIFTQRTERFALYFVISKTNDYLFALAKIKKIKPKLQTKQTTTRDENNRHDKEVYSNEQHDATAAQVRLIQPKRVANTETRPRRQTQIKAPPPPRLPPPQTFTHKHTYTLTQPCTIKNNNHINTIAHNNNIHTSLLVRSIA